MQRTFYLPFVSSFPYFILVRRSGNSFCSRVKSCLYFALLKGSLKSISQTKDQSVLKGKFRLYFCRNQKASGSLQISFYFHSQKGFRMLGFHLVVTSKNLLFCSTEMKLRVICIFGKCSTTILYPEPCDLDEQ